MHLVLRKPWKIVPHFDMVVYPAQSEMAPSVKIHPKNFGLHAVTKAYCCCWKGENLICEYQNINCLEQVIPATLRIDQIMRFSRRIRADWHDVVVLINQEMKRCNYTLSYISSPRTNCYLGLARKPPWTLLQHLKNMLTKKFTWTINSWPSNKKIEVVFFQLSRKV